MESTRVTLQMQMDSISSSFDRRAAHQQLFRQAKTSLRDRRTLADNQIKRQSEKEGEMIPDANIAKSCCHGCKVLETKAKCVYAAQWVSE